MAHQPEEVERYVCTNCQVTHAGRPVQVDAGEHRFEAPDTCGACGRTEFVIIEQWPHHQE